MAVCVILLDAGVKRDDYGIMRNSDAQVEIWENLGSIVSRRFVLQRFYNWRNNLLDIA